MLSSKQALLRNILPVVAVIKHHYHNNRRKEIRCLLPCKSTRNKVLPSVQDDTVYKKEVVISVFKDCSWNLKYVAPDVILMI